ncbi:hypothetical protein [Paraflavitalea speifideaquila]|uniref:hypothetical protein n=1 Tax=Paraflavitalea speifideaquila TaxID=3076558 RepID=UPI0028E41569|nr:hypothetical protein [Paraflavitalea speifideiaquila]
MRYLFTSFLLIAATYAGFSQQPISITWSAKHSNQPLDGRLLLLLSKNNHTEPRFQIVDGPQSQLAFGIDVENWKAGESKAIPVTAFGYPCKA